MYKEGEFEGKWVLVRPGVDEFVGQVDRGDDREKRGVNCEAANLTWPVQRLRVAWKDDKIVDIWFLVAVRVGA